MIFDLGLNLMVELVEILKNVKIILWNGLVGVFEFKNFEVGICGIVEVIV